MSLWMRFKRAVVPWYHHKEWRMQDYGHVHEVVDEHGAAEEIEVREAFLYRNAETGEYRRKVGEKLSTAIIFEENGPADNSGYGWKRIGGYVNVASVPRHLWESGEAELRKYREL